MLTRTKLALAALAAALLLSTLIGSTSANQLSLNEEQFKVTYAPLSFVSSFGSTIRCPVTFEGFYHIRRIPKSLGLLIGRDTAATVGRCEGGALRVNTETLPWHHKWISFSGLLPLITKIIKAIEWSVEVEGEIFGIRVTCRYTATSAQMTENRETTRGLITSERPGEESTASETSGCPSMRLSGTGSVTTATGAAFAASLI